MYRILLFLFILLSAGQLSAQNFYAKVVKIVDGDTYDVLDSISRVSRIRMNGIDAPEKGQAFGQNSKDELGRWCFSKTILVKVYSKDRNGRLIADGYVNGKSLSLIMIEKGAAWHFKKYSSDTTLSNAENIARARKLGLWAEVHPTAPWEYRKTSR
jgi:micrococcal nuclease